MYAHKGIPIVAAVVAGLRWRYLQIRSLIVNEVKVYVSRSAEPKMKIQQRKFLLPKEKILSRLQRKEYMSPYGFDAVRIHGER